MSYVVKEIFRSLQGEGHHAGTPVVFLRFVGCNIWDGVEQNRQVCAAIKGRCAAWCDTDFTGTGSTRYADPDALAEAVHAAAAGARIPVVITGGEPGLQLDADLVRAIHRRGHSVHVETNGTVQLPNVDWVCVSPKPPSKVVPSNCYDEVKVVFPAFDPAPFAKVADKRLVQPQYDADPAVREKNVTDAIAWVMEHPGWRLSLQQHKIVGLP